MEAIKQSPLFGLALSLLAYYIGMRVHRRWKNPLTTPILVAAALVIIFLQVTGITYQEYYIGGSYLNSMIVPATVSLGIPLYKTFHLMRHHVRSILIGSVSATIVNTILTAVLAKVFGLDFFLAVSLLPKSVTSAMAIGIADKMQGIATVTLVVVVATGIVTSAIGGTILHWLKIDDPIAVGLAYGGTGHAVGTGAALKHSEIAGAMSGLAIAVTGLLYVVACPLVASLILQ